MTKKQFQLLSFIRNSLVHLGKAPTFKNMRESMKVASNQAIEDWLSILQREGYIIRIGETKRIIRLTGKGIPGNEPILYLNKQKGPELKTYLGENYSSINSFGSISPTIVATNTDSSNLFRLEKGDWEGTK